MSTNTKKRGLGKGLSALMGEKPTIENILSQDSEINQSLIKKIPLGDIITNAGQPRKDFDDESLKELAKSIETNGVIQPILLRAVDDKYQIIAGERRYRASGIAKLKEIPAIIVDVDDENAAKLALIENIQREDLNPIEEAMAYKQLMQEFELKQEELANAIGKSRTYITNTIRLLNLDEKVIKYLYNGNLTTGHGKVLLGIKDKKEQIQIAEKIIAAGLNVRETETEVKRSKDKKKTTTKPKTTKDPYLTDVEEEFMRILGTKVKLVKGSAVSKIEIEFYDEEDLERIYEIITA
ncbi:MAG: ParB/RepB/Spo0J family partition protein [Tissierellaceae bacterium]|nr:ParB/RepB/Spo0J family partition protein [Tissierellaceae bacterium]